MSVHVLERRQLLKRPLPEVFAFFADARNLEAMTPPALGFKILTAEPIAMAAGTRIEYRIALFGVPFRWQTLIESFDPPRSFVDVQLSGPYRSWRHTHTFEASGDGTLVGDRVEYALPLGALGEIAHSVFVERQLRYIFEFRREEMDRRFSR